jgi:hypothetical protein
MKAKEFIPQSKPRNFVAKNQQTAGAGAHKDKKRAEKQGDVKHKKQAVPVESVIEISDKALQRYKQDAHTEIQGAKFGQGKGKPESEKIIAKREKGMSAANKRLSARDTERRANYKRPEPAKTSSGPQDWYGQNRYMGDSVEQGVAEGYQSSKTTEQIKFWYKDAADAEEMAKAAEALNVNGMYDEAIKKYKHQAQISLSKANSLKQGVAEVSKATIDRYVAKASDAHGDADFAARMSKHDPDKRSYHVDQKKTAEKRRQGISRALDRMSKEGVAEGMSRDEYNQIQYAIDNFKDEYGEDPTGPDIFDIADSIGVEPDAVINVLYGRVVPDRDVGEAKRPDRAMPATDLRVGDRVVADTSKENYPGGHKQRVGIVTRVGQKGVHIRTDDSDEPEWHPYKIVKKQSMAEGSNIQIPTEDGITWQDIRLMAGEGKLTRKTVLQAIAVIRKQRTEQSVAEDAVDDFLARGGEIQYGKFRKPRKSEKTDYGSKHIGGQRDAVAGKAGKTLGKAAATNFKGGGKPVVGPTYRGEGIEEARQSAQVKLAKAWDQQKAKSAASRERAKELLNPAKKEQEKKNG